jgi:hypothetical protein
LEYYFLQYFRIRLEEDLENPTAKTLFPMEEA